MGNVQQMANFQAVELQVALFLHTTSLHAHLVCHVMSLAYSKGKGVFARAERGCQCSYDVTVMTCMVQEAWQELHSETPLQ